MAKGDKPAYKVFVSRDGKDKTFYQEVGAAWAVGSDGISIQLNSLPIDGKLIMFPAKDDEG